MKNKSMLIFLFILTGIIVILAGGCKKGQDTEEAPVITTAVPADITTTSATCGGNLTSSGSSDIVKRGVCWSSDHNPSINDNNTVEGSGTGSFTSTLTGLSPNTIYYVRAYATNKTDTSYGTVKSFTTLTAPTTTVTDIDGNVYNFITIGNQVWMKENLRTTHYQNNQAIQKVQDATQWNTATTGAYCDYNNDAGLAAIYGHLYNFAAVSNPGKLCPAGWHVPTDADWIVLSAFVGGEDVAGGKLKEAGTAHWSAPNTGASNEIGFTALPGGSRDYLGNFIELTNYGHWWSSTQDDNTSAWSRRMGYTYPNIGQSSSFGMNGFSVRCIKD